jgi:hypothetical protein
MLKLKRRSRIVTRAILLQLTHGQVQLGLRLVDRHARSEPGEDIVVLITVICWPAPGSSAAAPTHRLGNRPTVGMTSAPAKSRDS